MQYTGPTEAQIARWEAREQRERAAADTASALLAGMVETFDGGGWRVNQREHMRYIVKGAEEIHVRLDVSQRRLTFHGCTPRLPHGMYYTYKEGGGSAFVSIDREPAAVARDVARRLLPTLRAALATQAAAVAKWTANTKSLDAFADEVASAAGSKVDRNQYTKPGADCHINLYQCHGAVSGKIVVGTSSSARFEVTVHGQENVKQAAELLASLKGGRED